MDQGPGPRLPCGPASCQFSVTLKVLPLPLPLPPCTPGPDQGPGHRQGQSRSLQSLREGQGSGFPHSKLAAPEGIWWANLVEGSRYLVQRGTTSAREVHYPVAACHWGWGWQARKGEMPGSVRRLLLELRIGRAALGGGGGAWN